MDRAAPFGLGFPPGCTKEGDSSQSLTSTVPASALLQPLIIFKAFWQNICVALIFTTTFLRIVSAQQNFSVAGTSYNCSANVICRGKAHVYNQSSNRIQVGTLSLVPEPSYQAVSGVAYYIQRIKFLDMSTRQSLSFNTSFTLDTTWGIFNGSYYSGDGMAFVISADNTGTGSAGSKLGFFDIDGNTTFKSIAVEFDTYLNPDFPENDISWNHVSFDFHRITWSAAANANASDVNVDLSAEYTVYAWVEYSSPTMQLEVRISNSDRRPIRPLLNYTVDLFEVVDEYMWVGFSSATGAAYSNWYVGDWNFQSYGIPASSSVPIRAPTGAPSSSVPTGAPTGAKSGGSKSKLAIIVGISVGVAVFLLTALVVAFYVWKRSGDRKQRGWTTSIEGDPMMDLGGMPKEFTYKQLSAATGAFREESKLGQGGFGSVYRGVLISSGIPIAVKKISSNSTQGEKEFMTEVSIISQLRHRNLIQILGWCKDRSKGKYLIVYELMPNGSLDKALFGPAESQTAILSWKQRFNIVTGIAAALDYLHQGWKRQIIHRDVKSSNIMLDEEWNAKLGDFGLARLVDHQQEAATTLMAGTYGYIAPEVTATGKFTEKTDVFAFGAVVLEVACGRKALAANFPEGEMILVNWVWDHLSAGDLVRTVDKRLEDYDAHSMEVMLTIGLLCSHPSPSARPSMRHVVQVLAGDAPVPPIEETNPASAMGSDNGYRNVYGLKDGSASNSRSGSTLLPSTSSSSATQGSSRMPFEISGHFKS